MRVLYIRPSQRVELIPETRGEHRSLDEQFGPWEANVDAGGLRGPAGDNFEAMICRREQDGAILIEIASTPEGDE